MTTRAWSSGPLIHWDMLCVQTGDPSLPVTLTGAARLVELHHWRRGAASPGVWVLDGEVGRTYARPENVDWSLFPDAAAEHEVMEQDPHSPRHLLHHSVLV